MTQQVGVARSGVDRSARPARVDLLLWTGLVSLGPSHGHVSREVVSLDRTGRTSSTRVVEQRRKGAPDD